MSNSRQHEFSLELSQPFGKTSNGTNPSHQQPNSFPVNNPFNTSEAASFHPQQPNQVEGFIPLRRFQQLYQEYENLGDPLKFICTPVMSSNYQIQQWQQIQAQKMTEKVL